MTANWWKCDGTALEDFEKLLEEANESLEEKIRKSVLKRDNFFGKLGLKGERKEKG